MNFFLMMIAPVLIIFLAIGFLFWWGAKSKERYE